MEPPSFFLNQDPYTNFYNFWMELGFSKMKPKSQSDLFPCLQQFYRAEPSYFSLYTGLHQNSYTDPLHFSVEVALPWYIYRVHFNGYMKSNKFIICNLTYTTQDDMTPKILVEFNA